MANLKRTVYPGLLPALREESKLTYVEIANQIDVTVGALMKWKAAGLTVDGIVKLLQLSANLKLTCAARFAKALQNECGGHVQIIVRR